MDVWIFLSLAISAKILSYWLGSLILLLMIVRVFECGGWYQEDYVDYNVRTKKIIFNLFSFFREKFT